MAKIKRKGNFDFYKIALRELMRINCKRKIIPFPPVFNRLGTMFHFSKKNSRMLLKVMEKKGYIEIIPFKGIRILQRKIEVERLARKHKEFKNKYFNN